MALITNIQHFLDEDGSLAELNFESIELLAFLTDLTKTSKIERLNKDRLNKDIQNSTVV
jgi:hypothetical protein